MVEEKGNYYPEPMVILDSSNMDFSWIGYHQDEISLAKLESLCLRASHLIEIIMTNPPLVINRLTTSLPFS